MMTELRQVSLPLPSRFQVHRKLGEGAFGNVFEVYDREQQCRVALKSLERLDANSLFRFKREFREIADIIHPNLVRLHELFCHEDRWFFTMDLVRGVSFMEYVRPGIVYSREAPTMTREEAASAPTIPIEIGAFADERRLRASLPQLAEGVGALHAAGKLHRDLKPQNVLVRDDGRVVILDFGLLDDIQTDVRTSDAPYEVVGTPAYMAPEAASGQGDGAESDWYSIGVMLYEALTGKLPFEGKPMSMLLRKQTSDPVNPEPLVQPPLRDLARLCLMLLARDPEDRPTLDELRTALQWTPSVDATLESDPMRRESDPGSFVTRQPTEFLVGREILLELLQSSFQTVVDGTGVLLRVFGRSGMGKSALVRFFLDDVRRASHAVTLVGRCFECESVPYKALDSLVDALTQRLMAMGHDQVAAVLPTDLGPMSRLFPVLRRVPLIAEGSGEDLDSADPHEVRHAAFAALRALLARLSEQVVLVLWIDDLQWGDEDSAAFLADLLQPPFAPKLLLITSYRIEDVGTSRMLEVLESSLAKAKYEHRDMEVGPLSPAECNRLASLLAGEESGRSSVPPPEVAEESGGSPLFLMQLVHHAARTGASQASADAPAVRLEDVLWEHVCSLPEPAQCLLRAVALAGRSIELGVARKAAGLREELRQSLDTLRMQRLLRTQGMRGTDLVEPYHDRIREVVTARLDAAAKLEIHRALATALEASGRADPEALVLHHRAAGNSLKAWTYAMIAAERADSALAFRRAADLYRLALELEPARDTHTVRVKLADALANAGHGAEASSTYIEALKSAPASDVLDLRRKAAEQSLRVGHVDQGLSLLQDMLAAAGMVLPRTPLLALILLLMYRAWLRIRGLRFQGRYEFDQDALRRIDIGWALAVGLSNSDAIRGSYIQSRALLLALQTGEPSRIARGLSLEAGYVATAGPKNHARAAKLVQASTALAQKLGDPYSMGWSGFGAAATAYFEGRFRDCFDECEAVYQLFSGCPGVSWERTTTRHYAIFSLIWLGEMGEAKRRIRKQLKAALERGDAYSAADLQMFTSNMAWLADDDVAGAQQAVDEAIQLWSKRGFHIQHYYAVYALGQLDLYQGDGAPGLLRIEESWGALRASLLMQVQTIRVEVFHLRARCAVSAAAAHREAKDAHLRMAEKDAGRLLRENSRYAPAMALPVLAAIAWMRGDSAASAAHLRRAVEELESAELFMFAWAAARRLGALADASAEERGLAEEATKQMTAQGVSDVERWTDLLAPGLG